MSFSLDEQVTTFTIEATDRSVVYCYCNDPVYQGKIERAGIEPYQVEPDGGKFYRVPINQLSIRKLPRKLTEAQRVAAFKRLEPGRQKMSE